MRIRWVLRLLGWNALLLLVGVVLIAIAGEAYLRLTMSFGRPIRLLEFVPNVGLLRPPNTEIRATNRRDFWNVSRTNSLGFLDREPPSPERAAATCHISMIGDSFVEAEQIPIHDKFHVRLEALAADELPHLNVTTSAFGLGGTGQVRQLPFYDAYARLLHPKLLVLVFVDNDFKDNRPIQRGNVLYPMVRRRSDGKLELAWSNPRDNLPPASWAARAMEEAVQRSRFARWLLDKKITFFPPDRDRHHDRHHKFLQSVVYPASTYTRFALEQFKQRADRDGARLVILASYTVKVHGTPMFERLSEMAAALDIPIIDQADYILRQGYKLADAHWRGDSHWNPAGHRWAAEALYEYIKEHPAICDGPT